MKQGKRLGMLALLAAAFWASPEARAQNLGLGTGARAAAGGGEAGGLERRCCARRGRRAQGGGRRARPGGGARTNLGGSTRKPGRAGRPARSTSIIYFDEETIDHKTQCNHAGVRGSVALPFASGVQSG